MFIKLIFYCLKMANTAPCPCSLQLYNKYLHYMQCKERLIKADYIKLSSQAQKLIKPSKLTHLHKLGNTRSPLYLYKLIQTKHKLNSNLRMSYSYDKHNQKILTHLFPKLRIVDQGARVKRLKKEAL